MVIQAYLFLEKKLKREKSEGPAVSCVESTSHPKKHITLAASSLNMSSNIGQIKNPTSSKGRSK